VVAVDQSLLDRYREYLIAKGDEPLDEREETELKGFVHWLEIEGLLKPVRCN